MINFEDNFFQKFHFEPAQAERMLSSSERDLSIAQGSDMPEVVFKFSYESLIKCGLACFAANGYRVRSVPGHHIKILEKLSALLEDENVAILGNRMRQMRNQDLYEAGLEISRKDSIEYRSFVAEVLVKTRAKIIIKSS